MIDADAELIRALGRLDAEQKRAFIRSAAEMAERFKAARDAGSSAPVLDDYETLEEIRRNAERLHASLSGSKIPGEVPNHAHCV